MQEPGTYTWSKSMTEAMLFVLFCMVERQKLGLSLFA